MNKSPMELFIAGGPIMWPMIFLSFVALTVVFERLIFLSREKLRRDQDCVKKMIECIEEKDHPQAIALGKSSHDPVAVVLKSALEHKDGSMEEAFGKAASEQLARFSQGLSILDTAITAAPLLGLLGTVIGMMNSFGEISGELGAPTAITGGIAEALVATACGLLVAVTSLVPYNFLNSRVDTLQREIDEAGMSLDVALESRESVDRTTSPDSNDPVITDPLLA